MSVFRIAQIPAPLRALIYGLVLTETAAADFIRPPGAGGGNQVITSPYVMGESEFIQWNYVSNEAYNLTLCQENAVYGSYSCGNETPIHSELPSLPRDANEQG